MSKIVQKQKKKSDEIKLSVLLAFGRLRQENNFKMLNAFENSRGFIRYYLKQNNIITKYRE